VPILRGGKLVGIVSRANLLQGLASLKNHASKSVARGSCGSVARA
jgi:hypothetical protein